MVDKKELSGLASYLGKYADQVAFDGTPVVRSDEYSLASFFKVRVPTQDGSTIQEVKLGPTELYAYPDGDQSNEPVFKGILDESGRYIPCKKDENGDFVVPTVDGQTQILMSAENLAKRDNLSRTVYKLNYLNHETVFQSQEKIPHPEGRDLQESEAYTIVHTSGGQVVGPIEYYTYGKDRKPEFVGILRDDGFVVPCDRNTEGDFEFVDNNQEKHVVPSAENELKKDPQKPYEAFRTEYFKGQPIFQQLAGQRGEEPQVVATQPRQTPEELLNGPLNEPEDFMQKQISNGGLFSDPRTKDKISPKR